MGRPFSEIGEPWCKWLKEDCMQIFRAEIERLKEERCWISVDDRLPGKENIIFYDSSGKWANNGVMPGFYADGKFKNFSHQILSSVTHWMPMPEPPEVA